MIKLNRYACPSELTKQVQEELTEQFVSTGNSVWKKPYIEEALLKSSNNKCAYCECKVDRESKYMEVEHYHDKHTYPKEVVSWDNLLPSCKRCNGNKSNFDTKNNDFINPYNVHPKEHLILNKYRLYPISNAAKNTIDELLLNDSQRLVVQRFEIAEAVNSKIEELYERAIEYKDNIRRTSQNRNKIISGVENLLTEALPQASYCATVATAIVNDVHFLMIKSILNDESLWSDSMEQKMNEVESNVLDTDISRAKEFLKQFYAKV
ncbi:HNH endonuclease [Bacillus sp. BR_7]|uniref:HNH endonuclease n=1 Tax=Bacillus TaxID=1386 RepID=UPI002079B91E|nr:MULTISPECIES: HNH endonuclease [Bacillus cereus group]MDA1536478.1 HNH endonuclease [Bacillus cereus group sp. TH254-2LC]USL02717.1 HNH endonuclease [Bacillus anthracis]HDR7257771.1 hypothetical protein [Bacillus paranthracis]